MSGVMFAVVFSVWVLFVAIVLVRTARKISEGLPERQDPDDLPAADRAPIEWPASRGTEHGQLMAMFAASEEDPNGDPT